MKNSVNNTLAFRHEKENKKLTLNLKKSQSRDSTATVRLSLFQCAFMRVTCMHESLHFCINGNVFLYYSVSTYVIARPAGYTHFMASM